MLVAEGKPFYLNKRIGVVPKKYAYRVKLGIDRITGKAI